MYQRFEIDNRKLKDCEIGQLSVYLRCFCALIGKFRTSNKRLCSIRSSTVARTMLLLLLVPILISQSHLLSGFHSGYPE